MTDHANDNLTKYAKMIASQEVQMLLALIKSAKSRKGSTACVVSLNQKINNPYRDDWNKNDTIAAIIRHGTVVTVMLTRKSQVNKDHFRTDRIARIKGN